MKSDNNNKDNFWTAKKKFAATEILMYVLMIVAIAAGILLLS